MSSRIGIVTADPAISTAIYKEILQQTPAEEQTDFVLYSRSLEIKSKEFEILEGTLNIKNMDVDAVAFPEIEQNIINKSTRQKVPLIQNELLSSISPETIKPIRDNLLNGTVPEDKENKKIYDDVMVDVAVWACALVEFANKGADNNHGTSLTDANDTKKNHLDILASSTNRHENGFIGLQGGMGANAGLKSFSYIAQNSKTSIVLDSSATMPNEAEYILELLNSDLHHAMKTVDPTDRLIETRERLEKMHPDVIAMTCNTAHYFEPKIEEATHNVEVVHIIEEGLKAIEPKENEEKTKLLLFATTASVNSKIFEDALKRTGRTDIEIIVTSDSEQKQINSAIWNDIIENKSPEKAGIKFDNVINNYPDVDGVIMGCTEVIFGMKYAENQPKIIVDNAKTATDKAMQIAEEKSQKKTEESEIVYVTNEQSQHNRNEVYR